MVDVSRSQAIGPAHRNHKTFRMFHAICKVVYLASGANFWFEDIRYPPNFMKIYKKICQVLEVIIAIVFLILAWGAFYTQDNLTEKQNNDMYLFALAHVVVYFGYANVLYYKREVRELILTLVVTLKEVCNDTMTERMMIRTTARYLTALVLVGCTALLSYGIGNGYQSLTSNATFTTLIPIWPDVEDRRPIAATARILYYIIWWFFALRFFSSFVIVLSITICLAHQFANLCKYFEGLNSIFEDPGTQRDKEKKYEDAFKVGIKMHALTLWSTGQTQLIGGVTFSVQMIINISFLVMLMLQMTVVERTLVAVVPILLMMASFLIGNGVFMWNAGDVTFEASRLPVAIFNSGWHNCQNESSVRVRKLVTISICLAQTPVVMKGLGFIELSYDSYVTIVKSSYSVFSVIY